MTKKEEEKSILNKIYHDKSYIITKSEEPDFIIENKQNGEIFGVEITKLYYNEASAKLKEIPNYESKILTEGIPRKDKGIIGKHEIYVNIDDEWVYLGYRMGLNTKTYDDYIDALIKAIKIKTEKMKHYKNLDYIELFIDDKEMYLDKKQFKDFEYLEKSKKLDDVLKSSDFKRIYLFTRINRRKVLWVYGDVHSGPLYTNEDDIKKHKDYMISLYNAK